MTDFRELCVELTDALDKLNCSFNVPNQSGLVERASDALAEPEPKGLATGGKKPLSLVCDCYMKGMPPNPHQDWHAYFDHCAATGTISGLRLEAIQPTPSVNDSIPQQPEPEGPTDEEIMELMPQQMRDDLAAAARAMSGFDPDNIKAASVFRIILNRHAVDHARAVLARWGK